MSNDVDLVERDRGILTKRDRQFLLGDLDEELTQNGKHQKRFQIRNRIRNAMLDFWFMNNALSSQDIGMLWEETDYWLSKSRSERRRETAPPYPSLPFLAECWRELIAFFVYSQVSTEVEESKILVEWVVENGINKGVRRHFFESLQMYQEIDATLEWGAGERYRLQDYLNYIGQQAPDNTEEAREYLRGLYNEGYLKEHHVQYVYQTYITESNQ